MPRPQFTLRSLLLAMLVVAAFFAGLHFERERRRREDEAETRLAFEADRAKMLRETTVIQARLSESSARLQTNLQRLRATQKDAEVSRPRVSGPRVSGPRVIPDVEHAKRIEQLAILTQAQRRAASAAQLALELLDAKLKEIDELKTEISDTAEARDSAWRRARDINEQINRLKWRPVSPLLPQGHPSNMWDVPEN